MCVIYYKRIIKEKLNLHDIKYNSIAHYSDHFDLISPTFLHNTIWERIPNFNKFQHSALRCNINLVLVVVVVVDRTAVDRTAAEGVQRQLELPHCYFLH